MINHVNGTNGAHIIPFPTKKHYGKFHIISDGLELGSNPTRCESELSLESVDSGRRIMCRRQAACVTFAASQKWMSFICDRCEITEVLSTDEQRRDIEGLATLLMSLELYR